MKALTVKQPSAWAIAHGGKPIENRPRLTRHRSELAIHAGVAWDARWAASQVYRAAWRRSGAPGEMQEFGLVLPTACVIAVVDIVGCHQAGPVDRLDGTVGLCCEPWGVPGWHWEIGNVRPLLDPVPCERGWLGLWNLPGQEEAEVRDELARVRS